MKRNLLFFVLLVLLGFQNCQKDTTTSADSLKPIDMVAGNRATVTVPGGSNDALAAAIAQAGTGGTVILAAGEHTESGTVTIGQKITLKGESGAILRVSTTTGYSIVPALHVLNAPDTKITGIDLRTPTADPGGGGILIEDSDRTEVKNCAIDNFQFSVLVEQSDNCSIEGNTITSTTAWQVGALPEAHGVIIINGKNAKVNNNDVSGALFGIWACDKNGHYKNNNVHHNFIGLILCKVPDNALGLPDGSTTGAQFSATSCKVLDNNAHDNFDAGYLVIDGATKNVLLGNAAANNGTYDIELVGDSYRFGFFTPTSVDNLVNCGPNSSLIVKDCGISNTVIGGVHVDTNADPCM